MTEKEIKVYGKTDWTKHFKFINSKFSKSKLFHGGSMKMNEVKILPYRARPIM